MLNTLVLLSAVCYFMYVDLESHYWVTLALAVLAGFLIVRLFIFQHDCGHGSFFKSRRANDIVGRFLSMFTMTPYGQWAREHNCHHATSGDLDNRGVGDVTTWTVSEYISSSKFKKICYRVYRNPFFLFTFGAFIHFMIKQRFPFYKPERASSWKSVMFTNIYMTVIFSLLIWWIGLVPFVKIYIPIAIVASSVGTWAFYVQHQFEDAYWRKNDEWDYYDAAIKGSSYYDLPKILHWLTGNIGYHHIHHLSSRIPNYNLARCHHENPEFRAAKKLGIWESRKSLFVALWDDRQNKMVGFKAI